WKDKENQDGKRPESVVIKLLADGEDTQKTVTLTEKNQWTGSFTELDEYKAGRRIEYTVEEVEVAGYKAVITGDVKKGFIVTNEKEEHPTPLKPDVPKDKAPKTGDKSSIDQYAGIMLMSGILLLLTGSKRRKQV
ncbi:MAG: Cna B-type domain-containing protein, partial [Lachnospiraceae bacterium]|nr:Cna B-type domain-containing protein [Lachnospiraceae bacterium]